VTDQTPPADSVIPLAKRHAPQVADLHIEGIHTGFLSSLGRGFIRQIYKALPGCGSGFGYVCEDSDGVVIGFVACAESTGRLYKQSLRRRGLMMMLPLLRFMFRWSVIKRLWQTLRYPAEVGADVPAAELLSIAVDAAARGRGVGKQLMAAAVEEFRRLGIEQFKVAVGADNETANAFYQRCGFTLALQREHHGLPMNIYVLQTGPPAAP
jgi:ribosomal protein S18 acetylase RimI-like enzyme